MKDKKVFLQHMLDEINFIFNETKSLDFENFVNNEIMTRACSRSLEIIGEAVKNLPDDFKKNNKDIEWKKLSGLRDKVIHCYFSVDWDIVWDVITNHIPKLKKQIENILNIRHNG